MKLRERIYDKILREVEAITFMPSVNEKHQGFEKTLTYIYEYVHKMKGKLIVSGIGKAGQIGANLASTFASNGTPAIFMHPTEAQHGDLGMMQRNDILLVISNSGQTREVLELVQLARYLNPDIKVIGITKSPKTQLAQITDVSIFTGDPEEICPLKLTPTTSTTVMKVIGDILVTEMTARIKFRHEDYLKRHHSGYLSEKAYEVMNESKDEPQYLYDKGIRK